MKLLRIEEAAAQLGLKPITVRKLIREGRLPAVRPTGARAVRIRVEDVEALTRIGAVTPTQHASNRQPGASPQQRRTPPRETAR